MEIKGFEFVEVKRADDHYRIFLKDTTFIGTYTEWEALLVAGAIERALAALSHESVAMREMTPGRTGSYSQR